MAGFFRLPRLQYRLAIVDASGRPTSTFMDFFNVQFAGKIESQENAQESTIQAIQQIQTDQAAQLALINEALQLAGLALETADAAGGGSVRSGSSTAIYGLSGTGFTAAGQVDLTTVSAGNLTIPGSGPSVLYGSTSMSGGSVLNGEYRIIEVDNGVDNGTVFTGTFFVTDVTTDEPQQVLIMSHTSAPDVSAFSDPRTTTGNVSYRVEVRRVSGAIMSGMRFYLFARRA